MLAKKFRLPSSVNLTGSPSVKTPEFIVKHVRQSLSTGRFGFIVAKSIDKRATVRNRLRRLVRAAIEEKWLEKSKGRDFLFIIRPAITGIQKNAVRQKVDEVMKMILA